MPGVTSIFFGLLLCTTFSSAVVVGKEVYVLDMAAKLDQTADYLVADKWGRVEFPPPFGRDLLPEEAYIAELDSKSGASLKLTVLNPHGRIWTMVAGGGASVVYRSVTKRCDSSPSQPRPASTA